MKSCLRIPRVLLPEKGFENWAVVSGDRFSTDTAFWEGLNSQVGLEPSLLSAILPEALYPEVGEEDVERVRESMYGALEDGTADKLNRGFIFVRRSTSSGMRRGIVAAVDLEHYTEGRGESSPVRPSEELCSARVARLAALRRGAPLEFPNTVLFYREKHAKLIRALENENLEKLYDFELMGGGGKIEGYYIPEEISEEVIHMLRSRAEPCFAVADGGEALSAAKVCWEELKPSLKEEERRNHPARFALAELVDLYEEGVVLRPVHRVLSEIDAEAFCSFFAGNMPCKRQGTVLYPASSDPVAAIGKTDELIARFLAANGGKVRYTGGDVSAAAAEEDCAAVILKTVEKEDLFSALKGGKLLPRHTFTLGGEKDGRYCLEGKEISYD